MGWLVAMLYRPPASVQLSQVHKFFKHMHLGQLFIAINKRTYCQWWTLGIWEKKKQVENSDWKLNGIAITLPLMMMMMIDSATAATDPWWKHEMRPHISQLSVFLVKPPLADRTAASCGFLKMWVVWWRCCLAKKNKKKLLYVSTILQDRVLSTNGSRNGFLIRWGWI